MKNMKVFWISLRLLGLSSSIYGADSAWLLSTQMLYAKPFRSSGYAGSTADGIGTQSRLEYRLQPWISLGLGYSETKIDQPQCSANMGFLDSSVRLIYANPSGIEPYVLVGLGAGGSNAASNSSVSRDEAGSGQAALGIMLSGTDHPWTIDGGIGYHRSGDSANAFNMAEGHVGLTMRFGKEPLPIQAKAPHSEPQAYAQAMDELNAKNYSKAVTAFDLAVQLDPHSSRAWHGLGNAIYMLSLGMKKKALSSWDRSLALNPRATQLASFVSGLKSAMEEHPQPAEIDKVLKLYRLSMLPPREQ